MASTDEPASLELWSLAAFRAASFTAAAVLLLHRRGSLAAALSRLDTATGFAAFLLLGRRRGSPREPVCALAA
jgi:hypothetical protein